MVTVLAVRFSGGAGSTRDGPAEVAPEPHGHVVQPTGGPLSWCEIRLRVCIQVILFR